MYCFSSDNRFWTLFYSSALIENPATSSTSSLRLFINNSFRSRFLPIIERFSNTFTGKRRTAEMTTWQFYLTFGGCCFHFLSKIKYFALAFKDRIIPHYTHLCTHLFKKRLTGIFRKRDSRYIFHLKRYCEVFKMKYLYNFKRTMQIYLLPALF